MDGNRRIGQSGKRRLDLPVQRFVVKIIGRIQARIGHASHDLASVEDDAFDVAVPVAAQGTDQ
jgi:hypothetical protein